MVRLGKESGLHSFEQVTGIFPILVSALHAVMKIKLAHSDPDLDSPPSMLWPAGRLSTNRPLKACSTLTAAACVQTEIGHISSETARCPCNHKCS